MLWLKHKTRVQSSTPGQGIQGLAGTFGENAVLILVTPKKAFNFLLKGCQQNQHRSPQNISFPLFTAQPLLSDDYVCQCVRPSVCVAKHRFAVNGRIQ